MHIEYRPYQDISSIVKLMKGRSSRKLQIEFPELKKRYLGRNFWAIGFGFCSTGNITDEMVNEYLNITEIRMIINMKTSSLKSNTAVQTFSLQTKPMYLKSIEV